MRRHPRAGMRRTIASGLALAALALAPLTACAAPAAAPGSEEVATGGTDAPQPTFDGPFAAEYTEAWTKAETDRVRGVLTDETITDQEWAETVAALKQCLGGIGITVTEYHEDGSYTADVGALAGEAVNTGMGECEKRSGEIWIGRLYRSQSANPTNIPATQLLTDCLVRNQAVPFHYTVADYLEDAQPRTFPVIDDRGPDVLAHCNDDPSYGR